MAERTLIIIKPDGVQRHLVGEIVSRFEKKGLKLIAAKFLRPDADLASRLYAIHRGKPFYEGLVRFLCSAPVLVMVWEAQGVIEITRRMLGATFGYEALPGTIRGDLGCSRGFNLVHGSDAPQSAEYEISLFFKPQELLDYEFADEHWLYGKDR
jgi:nucleoside-diphosphate kinase